VEHAAARDLEIGEAGLVENFGETQQLRSRHRSRERFLREHTDRGVDEPRQAGSQLTRDRGYSMKPALRRQGHSRRLVRIGVVGVILAAAAGAGSLAYATILVNQSVIHGCTAKSGGALRLASKCSASERA